MMTQQLKRSNTDKMIAGVCGGLAHYFGVDPVLTRLAMVGLVFAGGIGLLIYAVLWLIMPIQEGPTASEQPAAPRFADQTGQPIIASVQTERRQRVLGMVLLGIGLLMLSSMFHYGNQIVLALAFVLGGVYLLRCLH
jgi:phage shock protein C